MVRRVTVLVALLAAWPATAAQAARVEIYGPPGGTVREMAATDDGDVVVATERPDGRRLSLIPQRGAARLGLGDVRTGGDPALLSPTHVAVPGDRLVAGPIGGPLRELANCVDGRGYASALRGSLVAFSHAGCPALGAPEVVTVADLASPARTGFAQPAGAVVDWLGLAGPYLGVLRRTGSTLEGVVVERATGTTVLRTRLRSPVDADLATDGTLVVCDHRARAWRATPAVQVLARIRGTSCAGVAAGRGGAAAVERRDGALWLAPAGAGAVRAVRAVRPGPDVPDPWAYDGRGFVLVDRRCGGPTQLVRVVPDDRGEHELGGECRPDVTVTRVGARARLALRCPVGCEARASLYAGRVRLSWLALRGTRRGLARGVTARLPAPVRERLRRRTSAVWTVRLRWRTADGASRSRTLRVRVPGDRPPSCSGGPDDPPYCIPPA